MRARRRRAARMFARGVPQAEVARRLQVSRTSVSRWYGVWQTEGAVGLAGAGRAGRLPRLSVEQLAAVEHALLEGPRVHGFDTDLWTLARVVDVIERLTGVRYHPGHVWRVLKAMGWSRQRPARRAVERDDAAVAAWVKQDWPRIKKARGAVAPSLSSKTKAASR